MDLLKRIAEISRISLCLLFSVLSGSSLSPGETQKISIRPFIVPFQKERCSHFSWQLLFSGNQKKTTWMLFSNFSAPFIWFVFWEREKKKPYKSSKKFIRWMLHPSQLFKIFYLVDDRKWWGSDSNSIGIFVSDNEKCVLSDLTDTCAVDLDLPTMRLGANLFLCQVLVLWDSWGYSWLGAALKDSSITYAAAVPQKFSLADFFSKITWTCRKEFVKTRFTCTKWSHISLTFIKYALHGIPQGCEKHSVFSFQT